MPLYKKTASDIMGTHCEVIIMYNNILCIGNNDKFLSEFNIIEEKTYGISRVIFGNYL